MTAGLPYAVRAASGLRGPKLPNAGRTVAGVVEEVGSGVTGFAPGDEVYGTAAAAFAAARPDRIAPKPVGLAFDVIPAGRGPWACRAGRRERAQGPTRNRNGAGWRLSSLMTGLMEGAP